MNLKENEKGSMGGLAGYKGKGERDVLTISKSKETGREVCVGKGFTLFLIFILKTSGSFKALGYVSYIWRCTAD